MKETEHGKGGGSGGKVDSLLSRWPNVGLDPGLRDHDLRGKQTQPTELPRHQGETILSRLC